MLKLRKLQDYETNLLQKHLIYIFFYLQIFYDAYHMEDFTTKCIFVQLYGTFREQMDFTAGLKINMLLIWYQKTISKFFFSQKTRRRSFRFAHVRFFFHLHYV